MSGVATAIVAGAGINYLSQKDATSKATKAQQQATDEASEQLRLAKERARADINSLFPQASDMLTGGYQSALNTYQQGFPQQMQAAQQGNLNAQQTLMNALPQQQNAILGGAIDNSALMQPQALNYDLSFLQNAAIPNQQLQLTPDEMMGPMMQSNPNLGNAVMDALKGGSSGLSGLVQRVAEKATSASPTMQANPSGLSGLVQRVAEQATSMQAPTVTTGVHPSLIQSTAATQAMPTMQANPSDFLGGISVGAPVANRILARAK